MKISTRIRYGSRALVDIALYGAEKPVSLRDIAARQGVSQPYLEQVFLVLKAAGLVRSVRGARGGFLLTADPDKLTLATIVTVLGGDITVVDCVGDREACTRSGECVLREVWTGVSAAVAGVLGGTTLADLVEKERKRQQEAGK